MYHLVNHPTIHVKLHDNGTASLVKDCFDATYYLTRIAYWNPDGGGHGKRLSETCSFTPFYDEEAYHNLLHLKKYGGLSKVFPIKDMRPGQPPLGVRVFELTSEVQLVVQLGSAPHWIDIFAPEQLLLSYQLVPFYGNAEQLSILD